MAMRSPGLARCHEIPAAAAMQCFMRPAVMHGLCRCSSNVAETSMLAQEPEYVFIVGTVHFSETSAEDAAAVIQVCKLPIICRYWEAVPCHNSPDGTCMVHRTSHNLPAHISPLAWVYILFYHYRMKYSLKGLKPGERGI